MSKRAWRIANFIAIALVFVVVAVLVSRYGMAQLRENFSTLGIWGPIGLFALRFSSVVIPALPGTAYSIAAGALLGFQQGLIVVCLSDCLSCCLSFWLSRRYGRRLVSKLIGEHFMDRVDRLSQRHLERNFFLMTALMMTSFFDFVAYGVGLARAPWRKFLPALIISVGISTPPIVALGASVFDGGTKVFFAALFGMFAIALTIGYVRRNSAPVEIEQR